MSGDHLSIESRICMILPAETDGSHQMAGCRISTRLAAQKTFTGKEGSLDEMDLDCRSSRRTSNVGSDASGRGLAPGPSKEPSLNSSPVFTAKEKPEIAELFSLKPVSGGIRRLP